MDVSAMLCKCTYCVFTYQDRYKAGYMLPTDDMYDEIHDYEVDEFFIISILTSESNKVYFLYQAVLHKLTSKMVD